MLSLLIMDLFVSFLKTRYNSRTLIEKEGTVHMGHKSPARVATGSSSKPGQAKQVKQSKSAKPRKK